jgi:hypothetical protein
MDQNTRGGCFNAAQPVGLRETPTLNQAALFHHGGQRMPPLRRPLKPHRLSSAPIGSVGSSHRLVGVKANCHRVGFGAVCPGTKANAEARQGMRVSNNAKTALDPAPPVADASELASSAPRCGTMPEFG